MKLRNGILLGTLIAAVAGLGVWTANLQAQANVAKAVSVAVLDIETVFNELTERGTVEANIQSRIGELQKWENDKKKEITRMQNDLAIMDPDQPDYDKLQQDLRRAAINLRVELEVAQRQIEQQKAMQLESLYRKILDGAQTIAEQSGYDLVLLKDRMPNLRGANQQQVAALIQVRKLLYSAPELDITARVKQKLNNDWANR